MLIPFAGFLTYRTWWYFFDAFQSGEVSASYGGLIIWPARLLMFLGFALLLIQAFSELIKRVAVIAGDIPSSDTPGHQPAIEEAPR
jgi:TRAP-type mannitol/chloroaromatic compound transport system permease small subunit